VSESFKSALEKVDFGRYIDEIQEALRKAIAEVGPGRNPQEIEEVQQRLQALLRKQSTDLAKEAGLLGNQAMVFMLSSAIISTAWVSFALQRETSDLSKSPEDRLATIELFDALENALGSVIQAGAGYAERYAGPAKAPGRAEKQKPT